MRILLDNGHGKETPGKCSPVWTDGSRLFEWEFNRDIVRRIHRDLTACGTDCVIIVPEDRDVPLEERVRRANICAAEAGRSNSLLVSVHSNAGGGTGWEAFTSPGETTADTYATVFYDEAGRMFPDARMRYGSGGEDKEADLYILKRSICPAVLTENFFMDTENDCRLIMSETGREKIAAIHVNAIERCIGIWRK